ncbi:MAG TPA: helix-turn-helix domain-containing protein [Roseiarcus sp.]|jgi:excisionase family DNA binding protein|nr:helix-turn-helix domain-containing protein [Roseiarcus sp.]
MTTQIQKFERRALRPKEAAKAYGVSRTLIYEWMKTGRLKSVRLGGARLITVEALEALIAGASNERR